MSGDEDADLTDDALLGGRVRLLQPRRGYRAATDPVLLAAAVPARPGDRVLDLGCGAGAVALCLGARVAGLALHGLEFQEAYAALAERNGARNGIAFTVHRGDVADMPAALRALAFDHVAMNPPFFEAGLPAQDAGRDAARREGGAGLGDWIAAGLRRLRPGGTISVIQRSARLADILAALGPGAGDVAILPLQPREGRAPGRVIVQACKGSRAPLRLLPGLVLHGGARHLADGDDFTAGAAAILRDAAPLALNRKASSVDTRSPR